MIGLFHLQIIKMTKEEALKITQKKFTNLFGGDILPGVSVSKIISHYESLIADKVPGLSDKECNILMAFKEAEVKDLMDDLDEYYDGI